MHEDLLEMEDGRFKDRTTQANLLEKLKQDNIRMKLMMTE